MSSWWAENGFLVQAMWRLKKSFFLSICASYGCAIGYPEGKPKDACPRGEKKVSSILILADSLANKSWCQVASGFAAVGRPDGIAAAVNSHCGGFTAVGSVLAVSPL